MKARDARRSLGTLVLVLLLTTAALSQQSRPAARVEVPDTLPGKCAAAWFDMLRDGSETAVAAFENAWASPKRIARLPIAERTKSVKRMRDEMPQAEPREVLSSEADAIMLLVEHRGGAALTFEFTFDSDAPSKLDAILISDGSLRSQPMTPEMRTSTIEAAAKCMEESYVFPDVGAKMGAAIRAKNASGGYDRLCSESWFAREVLKDLRAISHDLHLGFRLDPEPPAAASRPMHPNDDPGASNYLFRKVEILEGNVGYLRLDGFLEGPEAEKTATAALDFLANTKAVIFDLRSNGGGSPKMIRFMTSWLFEKRTHLNDMIDRDGKVVEEYWTLDEIPGRRFEAGIPVFVLTSSRTFSGAEEFAYNLKSLKRGTIVGEKTGGGAHPVRRERLNDRFGMIVPFMRACNPVTKTNWEQKGVEPDIQVASDAALERAHAEARALLQSRKTE